MKEVGGGGGGGVCGGRRGKDCGVDDLRGGRKGGRDAGG